MRLCETSFLSHQTPGWLAAARTRLLVIGIRHAKTQVVDRVERSGVTPGGECDSEVGSDLPWRDVRRGEFLAHLVRRAVYRSIHIDRRHVRAGFKAIEPSRSRAPPP